MDWQMLRGDCREMMAAMPAETVDSIVTDPPYGLSFMGKGWDHSIPGSEFWAEALRVAKPGCHLLAFGGTRTYHRLACAIEDAGWEIRDCVMWVYGSGFPKSHDVSKAIDKAAGAEREVVGVCKCDPDNGPATDAARQWSGWGTALKPAWEPIIVARKPLCGTVAENVLRHGTGAINVDGCRVGTESTVRARGDSVSSAGWASVNRSPVGGSESGRWPANVIHDGSDEVMGLFPQAKGMATQNSSPINVYTGNSLNHSTTIFPPVREGYNDSGSAARFFYCAKVSKADRDEGCDGLAAIHRANGNKWTDQDYRVANGERPPSAESGPRRNHHPTVKPTALMRYLCRLVTPPDGVVLDPFAGSGSTGKAAILEGFRFVGIEREPEYADIASARIAAAASDREKLFS